MNYSQILTECRPRQRDLRTQGRISADAWDPQAPIRTCRTCKGELIAGIIGVINAEKPQKAKACIVWGALVAILSVAGTILGVVGGSDFSVSGLVLGLVLPVIYIIGAVKNMQSATSVG